MHKCKSALVTNIRTFNLFQVINFFLANWTIAWLESEIKCLGREEEKMQQARDFGQISERMQTAGVTLISSD